MHQLHQPGPESVQQASVCLLVKWPHGAVTHTQPLVQSLWRTVSYQPTSQQSQHRKLITDLADGEDWWWRRRDDCGENGQIQLSASGEEDELLIVWKASERVECHTIDVLVSLLHPLVLPVISDGCCHRVCLCVYSICVNTVTEWNSQTCDCCICSLVRVVCCSPT